MTRPPRALLSLLAASALGCATTPDDQGPPPPDVPAPAARARDAAPRLPERPTLDDLLAVARARSPALAVARAEVLLARLDERDALFALLPTLEANAGYTGASSPRRGETDFVGANGREEYVAQLGARLPLLAGLGYGAERRRAEAQGRGAEAAREGRERDLVLDVRLAWSEAVRAGEELLALGALAARLDDVRAFIEGARREGLLAELDAHRSTLEAVAAQVRLGAARAARARALVELAALLGVERIADVAPVGTDVAAPPALGPEREARLLAQAQGESPALAEARAALEEADADVERAATGHWPTVDAFVSGGWDSSVFPDGRQLGWSAGLGVRVPLFEWGRVSRDVERAELRRGQARDRLALATTGLARDVRATVIARDQAADALGRGLEALGAARRIVEQSRVGFEEGALTNLELLSAWQAATDAEVAVVQARHDLRAAEARLAALCGLGG